MVHFWKLSENNALTILFDFRRFEAQKTDTIAELSELFYQDFDETSNNFLAPRGDLKAVSEMEVIYAEGFSQWAKGKYII